MCIRDSIVDEMAGLFEDGEYGAADTAPRAPATRPVAT